jgi:hypothetical protein
MRKLIALIVLMCSAAMAQGKPPVIIGHIPMNDKGKLILSGQPCARKPESYFAYLRDEILVNYDDGDNYSYSVAGVQFTTEFDEWLKRENITKRTAVGEQTL